MTNADLKDSMWGNDLASMPLGDAKRLKELLDETGVHPYCLSTNIFGGHVDAGEQEFKADGLATLDHILGLAAELEPTFVRLLAAQTNRPATGSAVAATVAAAPFMIPAYQEAIDRINDAGWKCTIENEAWTCVISTPDEFLEFFALIDRADGANMTWDIQNQWATGTFPSLEGYHAMKDIIGYCHVKGGTYEEGTTKLGWNVALEEADWPVVEIVSEVVADGVSPVLCINPPSHGKPIPDYRYDLVAKRDIDFLHANIPGVI
jgi:sugar phosphate isomerase/epimerase